MVDYRNWSSIYDKTRQYNSIVVSKIMEYIPQLSNSRILDFGCGTGNYLEVISQLTNAQCYGIDASKEMIAIAKQKEIRATFYIGNHRRLLFPDNYFDFIYILDVLQHIPKNDLDILFSELYRILKPNAPLLFLTVSHQQLKDRTWNTYFPTAANIQTKRFPDIGEICDLGEKYHLINESLLKLEETRYEKIPKLFVDHVCNKAFSIFHLLDEQEYKQGKKKLLEDFKNSKTWIYNHGETIIVLRKKE